MPGDEQPQELVVTTSFVNGFGNEVLMRVPGWYPGLDVDATVVIDGARWKVEMVAANVSPTAMRLVYKVRQ